MQVWRLKENMAFKNYKELCAFLGVKVAAGNSKQAQLAEIARHCRLGKMGHQIHIKEVYHSPIKEKTSRGRKGIYSELLQALIMDFLVVQNISEICTTRNSILDKIGAVNKNFIYDEKKTKLLIKQMDIPEEIFYDFFNTTDKIFKSAFEIALKNLMKKELIHYDIVLMLAYQADLNSKLSYREATLQEINDIQTVEQQVLQQFGYKTKRELNYNKARSKKFTKQVIHLYNERYRKPELTLQFCYSAHKINVNEHLEEECLLFFMIQDTNQRELTQTQLNQLLCEQLYKNAEKRHQQALLELNKTDFITQARRSTRYVADSEQLIKRLIVRTTSDTEMETAETAETR